MYSLHIETGELHKIPYQDYSSCGDGQALFQDLTATSHWVDLVHDHFIHLRYNHVLKEIIFPYIIYDNKKVSLSHETEFEEIYFLRLDNCSARDAKNIEILSINDIYSAIETSSRVQIFLTRQTEDVIDLYLVPFNFFMKINRRYEFRATVYDNKLTTICQYYRNQRYTIEEIKELMFKGLVLANTFISRYRVLSEYVLDLFLLPGHETIIEVNSFGVNGVCGLPLFDWHKDYDQIYSKTNYLEVRFLGQ